MNNLVVIDYSGSTVNMYSIPKRTAADSEKVEKWILKNTDHKLDCIHYMTSTEDIPIIHH